MNPHEIIKALECCIEVECDECPFDEQTSCIGYVKQGAIDLINRQKAEIKDWETQFRFLDVECCRLEKQTEEQQAEIERLRDLNNVLETDNINANMNLEHIQYEFDLLKQEKSVVKSEAIKEFVKEHREIMLAFCDDDDQISLKVCEYDANTNDLVKEMTEGNENA